MKDEAGSGDMAGRLLEVVASLLAELQPHRSGRRRVTLDSPLERELGLDSLSRMELASRLERALGATLPERAVAEAETPRDLLRALRWDDAATVATGRTAPPVLEFDAGDAVPDDARTLVDALEWHAQRHPSRPHVHLLGEDGAVSTLDYGSLHTAARRIAGGLLEAGVEPGHTVAIMLPSTFEYFEAFFGALFAGAVPVPIYPPARASQIEEHLRRHAGILDNAGARVLITFDGALAVARLLSARVPGMPRVTTPATLRAAPPVAEHPPVGAADLAFLQYTSGSTGDPKGVMLSHGNVLASLRAMADALEASPRDVFVSWLPLYHDMGLIGAWLGSVCYGFPLVLMSPLRFLARPVRWLQAISQYRGTLSGGPNFAYELCAGRIEDADLEGLDLGSWRVAFNGAEPVSPDTVERFAARFAACGFRREAIAPVYGLAEATLGVAFTPLGRGPRVDRVGRRPMTDGGRAEPAAPGDADALAFVSCGPPIPGFEVRIVDDAAHEAVERAEGRIQFRGAATTAGYFRNAAATRGLFDGDWIESGDRGYVAGGELHVTGRSKDVVIRAGRNIYPYEVEDAVAAVEGVRRGCVAVFGTGDPAAGTERLVVVAETREENRAALSRLQAAVEEAVLACLGQPADEICLVAPRTVLKTSSGKIRRAAMRALHEQGRLGESARAPWLQVVYTAGAAALPAARSVGRRLLASAYSAWVWLLIGLGVAVAWPLAALARRPPAARACVRASVRAVLRLAGLPLAVEGLEHLPAGRACLLVANHASYLDGLVLHAALPRPPVFVVKGELRRSRLARPLLEGIGARFVERFDAGRGASDADAVAADLAAGRSVLVFAEGTLHRMPGLLPFQLGGFVAAVRARAPVVPVVLRGTRSVLRDGSWFFRRGPVRVRVDAPIEPGEGEDFRAAVALRDRVRARVLALCGEPDLADRRPLLDLAERSRAPS